MTLRLPKIVQTISLHLLFWIGVWFFFYYFFSYNSNDSNYIIWFSSCLLPLTMGVTYFMERILIPRFLLKRQYQLFALYTFYTFVISSYLIVLALYGCLIFLLKFNVAIMPPMSKNFMFILILVYLVVGVISFISVLSNTLKTDAKNKELENKILATQLQLKEQELHYLKRQIHPHFLFNTLNTIYGFALQQSKHTPEIILKLSNLLDYILYQINQPKVALKEEVLHIKEYIELEKIRFKDSLKISFNTPAIDSSIEVAPMLLIPFVENAFKHGELLDGFLSIDASVKLINHQLEFNIVNSIRSHEEEECKEGIGLSNIKKRLDLNYKNKYQLSSRHNNGKYEVQLIIDLKPSEHE